MNYIIICTGHKTNRQVKLALSIMNLNLHSYFKNQSILRLYITSIVYLTLTYQICYKVQS